MTFTGKLLLMVLIAGALGVMAPARGIAQDAECAQARTDIANKERELREWENYVRQGGPGVSEAHLGPVREELAQMRAIYQQRCGGTAAASPGGGPAGPAGSGGSPEDEGGYPEDDNPFAANGNGRGANHPRSGGDPASSGRHDSDPDNPFASLGRGGGANNGGTNSGGARSGGYPASAGRNTPDPDNPFASLGERYGANNAKAKVGGAGADRQQPGSDKSAANKAGGKGAQVGAVQNDESDILFLGTVELYTSKTCPYCQQAQEYFQKRGIAYYNYDVDRDPSAKRRLNNVYKVFGVPFAIIGDRQIKGYHPDKYAVALRPHTN